MPTLPGLIDDCICIDHHEMRERKVKFLEKHMPFSTYVRLITNQIHQGIVESLQVSGNVFTVNYYGGKQMEIIL